MTWQPKQAKAKAGHGPSLAVSRRSHRMAKRRNYKRDRRGRFAPTASRSSRVKRAVPTKVVSRKMSAGRVGPGAEYVGVRAGIELKPKRRRSRYYVGVTAGHRVSY